MYTQIGNLAASLFPTAFSFETVLIATLLWVLLWRFLFDYKQQKLSKQPLPSPSESISAILTRVTVQPHGNCPVCLDAFARPVQLPCGHEFCEICIRSHFSQQDACPLDNRSFFEPVGGEPLSGEIGTAEINMPELFVLWCLIICAGSLYWVFVGAGDLLASCVYEFLLFTPLEINQMSPFEVEHPKLHLFCEKLNLAIWLILFVNLMGCLVVNEVPQARPTVRVWTKRLLFWSAFVLGCVDDNQLQVLQRIVLLTIKVPITLAAFVGHWPWAQTVVDKIYRGLRGFVLLWSRMVR